MTPLGTPEIDLDALGAACEARLRERMATETASVDAAHDLAHVRRVVRWATRLGRAEDADLAVVVPAAWLHDLVMVPKDDPRRNQASRLAAAAATEWLGESGYPAGRLGAVAHAIEAHSFSAGIPPETLEAQVVQDADRLDALGAIGLARCYATAGAMGSALVHPDDPVPSEPPGRALDDRRFATDHLFAKLFRLPATMQTAAGRAEAERRVGVMRAFVEALRVEMVGT